MAARELKLESKLAREFEEAAVEVGIEPGALQVIEHGAGLAGIGDQVEVHPHVNGMPNVDLSYALMHKLQIRVFPLGYQEGDQGALNRIIQTALICG